MKSLVADESNAGAQSAEEADSQHKPTAKCRSRTAGHRRKIEFTQSLLSRNVNPAIAAEVLLVLRGRFSARSIASQLHIPFDQALELLMEGRCRHRFGANKQNH
jgi:hypothetical protein